jgi:hypothetical protein
VDEDDRGLDRRGPGDAICAARRRERAGDPGDRDREDGDRDG